MNDARECVWPLVDEAVRAVDLGLYYVGLMAAVVLPDVAASLSDPQGKSSESKYRAWVEQWLSYNAESAVRLYKFRCALLHEASFVPHRPKSGEARSRPCATRRQARTTRRSQSRRSRRRWRMP